MKIILLFLCSSCLALEEAIEIYDIKLDKSEIKAIRKSWIEINGQIIYHILTIDGKKIEINGQDIKSINKEIILSKNLPENVRTWLNQEYKKVKELELIQKMKEVERKSNNQMQRKKQNIKNIGNQKYQQIMAIYNRMSNDVNIQKNLVNRLRNESSRLAYNYNSIRDHRDRHYLGDRYQDVENSLILEEQKLQEMEQRLQQFIIDSQDELNDLKRQYDEVGE